MSELEEAIAKLGRESWHGINIIGGNTDFWPVAEKDFEKHKADCPIWNLYDQIVRSAANVKAVWNKTSKQAKETLFAAAMEVEKREGRKICPTKEKNEERSNDDQFVI